MFALRPTSSTETLPTTTPNILPCKISHSGPVNASKRHWRVEKPSAADKTSTYVAHFRGRKLLGKCVPLPTGYRGVVVEKTDDILPRAPRAVLPRPDVVAEGEEDGEEEDEDEDEEQEPEVKLLSQVAEFDGLTVWGHEALPEDVEDVYVKGVEEWVRFARKVRVIESW